MASTIKDLHLAKSLGELNSNFVSATDKMKTAASKILCKTADKIYLKAKDAMLEGDEELSYIYYMRFLDAVGVIRKSKEYKTNRREFDQLLSSSKFSSALNEAERLSGRLKERYAGTDSTGERKKESDCKSAGDASSSVLSAESVFKNNKKIPLLPQNHSSHGNADVATGNAFNNTSDTSSEAANAPLNSIPSIAAEDLYHLLCNSPDEVLVLDCRCRSNFMSSHVDTKKYPQWLSVPEEVVMKGLTSTTLQNFLTAKGKKLWKERGSKKLLVLLNEDSTSESLGAASATSDTSSIPILNLKDAIYKWDSTVHLSQEPRVLQGGYAQWYLTYPPLCIGQWRKREKPPLSSSSSSSSSSSGDRGKETMKSEAEKLQYPTFPLASESDTKENLPSLVETAEPSNVLPKPPSKVSQGVRYQQQQVTSNNASADVPNTHGTPPQPSTPAPHPPPPPPHPQSHMPHHPPSSQPPFTLMGGGGGGGGGGVGGANVVPMEPTFDPQGLAIGAHPSIGYPVVSLPPPSVIPVALSLEGEASLLTPTLSSDDHMTDHMIDHVVGHVTNHTGHMTHNVTDHVPGVEHSNVYHPTAQQGFPNGAHQQQAFPNGAHQQQAFPNGAHQQQAFPNGAHQQQAFPSGGYQQVFPSEAFVQGQEHAFPQQPAASMPYQAGNDAQAPPTNVTWNTDVPQPEYPFHHDLQAPPTQPHPPMQVAPPTQPHPPVQVAPPPQPHPPPTQMAPPPQMAQPHPPRVAYGPIPDPPSYDHALHIPSQVPVGQPLPPPVSVPSPPAQVQPREAAENRFDQSQKPVQQVELPTASEASEAAEQKQMNEEAQRKVKELEMKVKEMEEQLELKQQREKHLEDQKITARERELEEMKRALSSERESLVEEQQRQKAAMEAERVHEQMLLQQEKDQFAQQAKQEREAFEAEKLKQQKEMEAQQQQLEQMKLQYLSQVEKQRILERTRRQQETQPHQFTVDQGLPPRWEKRLDPTTARFYYIDHNTKTTHWDPPTDWLNYQAEVERQRSMAEQNKAARLQWPHQQQQINQPRNNAGLSPQQQQQQLRLPSPLQPSPLSPSPSPPSSAAARGTGSTVPVGGATRPHPHHAQTTTAPQSTAPTTGELNQRVAPTIKGQSMPQGSSGMSSTNVAPQSVVQPKVDRSTKPVGPVQLAQPHQPPAVNRNVKPLLSVQQYRRKMEASQPVYGTSRYVLTGLRNLGNTCFMNSTLQCLCSTTPLALPFSSGRFQKEVNLTNPLGSKGELAVEFSYLMKAMWSGEYRSIAPRDFKGTIGKFASQFAGTSQQDSQEFLAFFLDGLHEDMNRITRKEYIEEKDNSGLTDSVAASLSWKNHMRRNDSIIVDLFQGQFRSTVMCLTCRHKSVTFDAFMYLSVPIPPGADRHTVESCIELFTRPEKVSGVDKWYCSHCRGHRDASKRIEIWKLPPILLIHLKRFSFHGMWREKRQNFISFQSQLDMTPYVVGIKPNKPYSIYGITNHYGTIDGGHYTAFCMNPYKRQFYCFDDQEVRETSPNRLKTSAAYVLFYTSVDLTPPRVM